MSKLIKAIKRKDTNAALDLIYGISLSSRIYKRLYEYWYGDLLDGYERVVPAYYESSDIRMVITEKGPLDYAIEAGLIEVVRAILTVHWVRSDFLESHFITALRLGHDQIAEIIIKTAQAQEAQPTPLPRSPIMEAITKILREERSMQDVLLHKALLIAEKMHVPISDHIKQTAEAMRIQLPSITSSNNDYIQRSKVINFSSASSVNQPKENNQMEQTTPPEKKRDVYLDLSNS